MPNDDDHGLDGQRREAKRRSNWFSIAKNFVLKACRIYDVGHDDHLSEHHSTAHNQWILLRAPSTSYVVEAEARGQTDNHWRSYRLLT